MQNKEFFTFREYMKKEDYRLTACMEDYLEMIYRLSSETGFTRIHDLASSLNIQPPSATKMVKKLAKAGLVNYEKYGVIVLSKKGVEMGRHLLNRHMIVETFLQLLGVEKGILEETEKIEHTLSENTLSCIKQFVDFLKANPSIIKKYKQFTETKEPG